jgi:hypothetical protein
LIKYRLPDNFRHQSILPVPAGAVNFDLSNGIVLSENTIPLLRAQATDKKGKGVGILMSIV